jgi:hypothetical protein
MFAGWPANHGAWQWGNELLVGFLTGTADRQMGNEGGHAIRPPYVKMLARSNNGGESWYSYVPNVDFEASGRLASAPPANLDLGKTPVRVCGRYDTGGDHCRQGGGFYVSFDKGVNWEGPYRFDGLENEFEGVNHNTSRTREMGDTLFLTAAKKNQWGTDYTFTAKFKDGKFYKEAKVLKDSYRAVMPAYAEMRDQRIVALRRKGGGHNWIDIVSSDFGGPWRLTAQADKTAGVANTGTHNGNPPALCMANNFYILAYGDRSAKTINVTISANGKTWRAPHVLRRGTCHDIGYPQLFVREDGLVVCVYYWADHDNEDHRIESTIFNPLKLR